MKEIYKFYKTTYNGIFKQYYVSNYGNVKMNGDLYECNIDNRGYKILCAKQLHRIVAKLFIPNLENKPEIDHIDTNKLNNRIDNLRWVTRKENMNNILTREHIQILHMGKKLSEEHKRNISNGRLDKLPVIQYDLNNNYISSFESISEAERITHIYKTNILMCCKNKRKTAGGYKWQYKKTTA